MAADEGVFAAAAAQVEHAVPLLHPAGGVTTAVIPLNDSIRNHLEQGRVEADRGAKAGFLLLGSSPITRFHSLGLIQRLGHLSLIHI